MPRYFFNVRTPAFEELDISGRACANDVAALARAMEVAGEVVREQLERLEGGCSGEVHVEDEAHRLVMVLPMRAAAY
ncbi:MAG: hypothetical protein QOH04_3087 [Sphingomonadales bacterium]|jgi:hypothetical protein|nr:hypothetical protein [Sphingomonadales bacterium]